MKEPEQQYQGRQNDLVFGTAIHLEQQCLLFFKQYVIYFE